MEESLKAALRAGAECLAQEIRAGLREHELPSDIEVIEDGNRFIVASRSEAVSRAEAGLPGTPPVAIMEGIARHSLPVVISALMDQLGAHRL